MGFLSRIRSDEICALAGDPTGDTVLALTAHGRVDSWDTARGASSLLTDDASAVAVRDDGNDVFVVSTDGNELRRYIRQPRFGNRSVRLRSTAQPIIPPAVGGAIVATRHAGQVIVAQYVAENEGIQVRAVGGETPPAQGGEIRSSPPLRLAISADASVVVATFGTCPDDEHNEKQEWRAWRVNDGVQIGCGQCEARITAIAVERTGSTATVGAACGGTVRAWTQRADIGASVTRTSRLGFTLETGPVTGLHLAVDRGRITTTAPGGTLRRWDRPPARKPPDTMAPRRFASTAVALVVLVLWWVLRAIGDVLRGLHLPGSLGA
jgi:hypothetical protein